MAYLFAGKQLETYPDERPQTEPLVTIPVSTKGWTDITHVRLMGEQWAKTQSIAHGAAGVAILHVALDRTGGDREVVHRWLAAAVAEQLSAAPGAGAWWTTDPPSGRPTVRGGHSDQGAAHGIAFIQGVKPFRAGCCKIGSSGT